MLDISIKHSGFDGVKKIISDLNFRINDGEVLAIVGDSGVGKSTFLKTVAGLIPHFDGSIKLDNRIVKQFTQTLIPGDSDIALVNQDFKEDLYFTVEENIRKSMLHLTKADQASFLLELIGVLSLNELIDRKARYLSGGEKQRVSLACALAKEPRVLLLDEPFAHIDVYLRNQIGVYLKQLVKEKKTIIVWVSHEGEEAMSWGDSILIANKTSWEGKFTPKEVYFDLVDRPFARYFGEINQVEMNESNHYFRPWNYDLNGSEEKKISLDYIDSNLRNGYFANYFKTKKKEEVILFSFEPMKNCKEIYVHS